MSQDNTRWGKFRSVEDGPRLQSYRAEVFCDRRSQIPLFVMWTQDFNKPLPEQTWFVRGVTDEFRHDVQGSRLIVIKYVEDILKILEDDFKRQA